nr:carboxyl transferase domain-containing protein [Nonomuraea terrae]
MSSARRPASGESPSHSPTNPRNSPLIRAPMTAQIAVMGAQGAVNILHRRRLAAADDPDALRAELVRAYEDTLATPYLAAERGYVDAMIRPSETRREVTLALRLLRGKRDALPPKKHGNIPL